MADEQNIGKQEKDVYLKLICNRFYFGEAQEEVLGHCSEQGIPHAITSTRSHFHVFKLIVWGFLSLIMKDAWAMTSSKWELHVAAKFLTNLKHLKGVSTSLLILEKKQLTYKISKETRIFIASVVGLDHLSSNLPFIILLLITKLIFKYNSS